jgi:hypothetical protein
VADPPGWAYVVVLAVYVVLGVFLKTIVLNWIVGPLFLVLTLHLLPNLFDRRR